MSKRARGRARSTPPSPRIDTRRAWWAPLILMAAGVAIYAAGLSYLFVFDDQATIRDNASIRDLASLRVFAPDRETPSAGRPLVNLSHAVNFALNGVDPFGYRVGNLAVHLLCAIVLLAVVRRTLASPRVPDSVRQHGGGIAFASALAWTVHPLNTEVVEYITQRSESMMALCYLLTIYAALRAIDTPPSRRWSGIAVAVCAAGMLCKESMVTAPCAVFLYDRTFVFGSWTAAWRGRWRLYAALAGTWAILAFAIWSGPRAYSAGFGTSVSVSTYLLNQGPMIVHYLRLVFWPRHLVVAYGPTEILRAGDVLPYVFAVIALLAGTLVAMVRWPLVGFVGAWLFLTLSPTSSVVPIATEVGAERRMYLALAAIVPLVAAVVAVAVDRIAPARARTAQIGICAVITILLAAASIARVGESSIAARPGRNGAAAPAEQLRPRDCRHAAGRGRAARRSDRGAAAGHSRLSARLLPPGGELFNAERT